MEGRNSGRAAAFTVEDLEQARLLSEPRFQDALRPFLARESSASAAASEMGIDLNAMLYRIRLLLAAGLLDVVREEKRQGRPIKIYRSAHDSYFVPYEVTPFADLEERIWQQQLPALRELTRVQARRLQQGGRRGQLLFRDASGKTWTQSASAGDDLIDWLDPSLPASLDYWTEIELSEGESRAVQRQLYDLLQTYAVGAGKPASEGVRSGTEGGGTRDGAASGDGASRKRYRLSVALVPMDD